MVLFVTQWKYLSHHRSHVDGDSRLSWHSMCLIALLLAVVVACKTAPTPADSFTSLTSKQSSSYNSQSTQSIASHSVEDVTPSMTQPTEDLEVGQSNLDESSNTSSKPISLSPEKKQEILYTFLKGSLLEEQNQFEEASEIYKNVVKEAPHSSYANAIAGQALLRAGKVDEAIQMAEQALLNQTQEPQAHRVLGQAYIEKNEWNKAIHHYQEVIKLNPLALDLYEELAILYVQQQRFDDAIELYRRLIKKDPSQSILYHFKIASWLYQLRRFDEALSEYKILAEQMPQYYDVHYKIGTLHELLGNPSKAIEAYENTLNIARNQREELAVRERLGSLYRSERLFEQALTQYEKIHEIEPSNQQAEKFLTLLYVEQQQYEKAYEIVHQLVRDHKVDFRIHLLHREVLTQLGRNQEAYETFVNAFEKSVEENRSADVFSFLGHLSEEEQLQSLREYDLLDRYHQIIESKDLWLEQHPRFLFADANIDLYQNNQNEIQQSLNRIIKTIKEAAEEEKSDYLENLCSELRIWNKVRAAFQNQNIIVELENAIDFALETFPNNTHILRTKGTVLIDLHRWEDAERILSRAKTESLPNTSAYNQLLFQLALVYDKLNRLDDVESVMNEAIDLNPNNAQPYNFLGYTYADRNVRLDDAMKLIEKALKLNPNDGNIMDSLGWVYYQMGRNDEAIHFLEKANQKEPNHPVILDHLGDAHKRKGNQTKALQYYQEAWLYGPDYPFEFTPKFQETLQDKIQELETIE